MTVTSRMHASIAGLVARIERSEIRDRVPAFRFASCGLRITARVCAKFRGSALVARHQCRGVATLDGCEVAVAEQTDLAQPGRGVLGGEERKGGAEPDPAGLHPLGESAARVARRHV